MQKNETTWAKNNDWKSRYSKLYSSRHFVKPEEDSSRRISFMSNNSTPFTSLLPKIRASQRSSLYGSDQFSLLKLPSTLSQQSAFYESYRTDSIRSDSLGGHETLLLDMVRAHSREVEESQDKTLDLPRDDTSDDESEVCFHGLNMRMTDRSVSRSRVSRISTRRDMDIPSILAFTASVTPGPAPLEIPAFAKANVPQKEDIPKWSIRRSVCPVCSQKWRDKSFVKKVKYSGLKRNAPSDFPSVIAPARLRASITMAYCPRPALSSIDEDVNLRHVPMRNSSGTWQFTRARRFRIPKPQLPTPDANAPPTAAAPMAQKDLDIRVSKFISDTKLLLD